MELSIVIPVFNEEANLVPLFDELKTALSTYKACEIVFVDDGSTDSSFSILKKIQESNKQVKVIRFRRNFGQTAALAAGFKYAEGDVIVTMDADCQNDPADIPKLLAKIDEGHDLVSGWRYDRKDRLLSRRLPSRIANFLISWTTDVKLHDYGCTLKAIKKEVAKSITLYGELHRFIPAVASWMGVNIAEVKVNHRPRHLGQSKYGISRTFRVLLDLITVKFLLSYSGRPIHFFGLPGLVCGFFGFLLALYMTIERLFFGIALANRPLLLFAVLLILIGIQFIVFGLLAELQTRTYHETQNKSIFVVKETHGYK
jgi:glycosyltransferase involved in cell wall biosynthesis